MRTVLMAVLMLSVVGCDWEFLVMSEAKARAAIRTRKIREMSATPEDRWGESIAARVREGKICLGMSKAAVTLSWGRPEHRNRSVTRYGLREQWVYGSNYVYFEGNVVTGWQSH